jgi:hypothetical protein
MKSWLLTLVLLLAGCGPSARETEAHTQIRAQLAALKTMSANCTYREFRLQRLAFQSTYTLYQPQLAAFTNQLNELSALLDAGDACWNFHLQFPRRPVYLPSPEMTAITYLRPDYPSVVSTTTNRYEDPRLQPLPYAQLALSRLASQSGLLLQQIP